MKELTYSLAPADWAICYRDDCPMAGACLRHAVAQLAPADLACHTTVLPAAQQSERCQLFATKEPVRIARGMRHLIPRLPVEEKTAVLHALYDIFGSRSQYYRYRDGQFPVTPEQQASVAALFRKKGIAQEPAYDTTTWEFYFPGP